MLTAQALGADVFGELAQWTDEFFSFEAVQAGADPLLRYSQAGAVDEIARSVDTLDSYGISDIPLVPGWLPEGVELNTVFVYYDGAEQLLFRGIQEPPAAYFNSDHAVGDFQSFLYIF